MKNKKGVADILTILFAIIICLALVVIIWATISKLVSREIEISDIKIRLTEEQIKIEEVKGDLVDPSIIHMTLKKGAGKINVESEIIEVVKVFDVDAVSVMDLSGSMCDCDITWGSCRYNQQTCEDNCGGTCQGGIYEAKESTKSFIDMVLDTEEDTESRIGLVGYRSSILEEDLHILSDNADSLKSKADEWMANGGTCICCGINRAVDELTTSEKTKIIIVMTDGEATVQCTEQGTGSPSEDSIQAARQAYEGNNIQVYSIGFGNNANTETLESIAEEGGGVYYYADVSELEETYRQISEEFKKTYTVHQTFNYLKIIFYTSTASYEERIPFYELPGVLESKTYTIDLSEIITDIEDITKIELYPVVLTEEEKEIIGPQLYSWSNSQFSNLKKKIFGFFESG